MKLRELILKLQEHENEHGDKDVIFMDPTGTCDLTRAVSKYEPQVYLTNKGRIFIRVDDDDDHDWEETDLETDACIKEREQEQLDRDIASGRVKIIDGKRYVMEQ